ncbi:Ribonuclease H2 subunit A [Linum grandiflorum]
MSRGRFRLCSTCLVNPTLLSSKVATRTDSKTLKEEKRKELFESLKVDQSIGWAVDVIDPRKLSAKMLKKNKINLNEISPDSASGLVKRVLNMGVILTEVYVDTVGDPEKYRVKLSERFPSVKFVVAKKADSLYPVVSGANIVAKVPETNELSLSDIFGNKNRHKAFGLPALVRFSWGTCNSYFKDGVEVLWVVLLLPYVHIPILCILILDHCLLKL